MRVDFSVCKLIFTFLNSFLVDLQLHTHGHFACLTSHQISMAGVEESAEFFNQDDFSFTCQIISITVQLSENQHNAAAAAAAAAATAQTNLTGHPVSCNLLSRRLLGKVLLDRQQNANFLMTDLSEFKHVKICSNETLADFNCFLRRAERKLAF